MLVLLLSCNTNEVHQSVALPLRPPAQSAARVAPDPCAGPMSEQRAKLERAIAADRHRDPSAWADGRDRDLLKMLPDLGVACWPFARGAWALELQSMNLYDSYRSLDAILVPVLYAASVRTEAKEGVRTGYGGMFTTATSMLASDYDGDGIPELYLHTFEEGVEGGHAETGALYTFTNGEVIAYAPAANVEDIGTPRDIDGDGRLDLPTSAGISLNTETMCDGGKGDWQPAAFVAHALPNGQFSVDDAVAKKFARTWCPALPTNASTPKDALCAKLWSGSIALLGGCVPWDCNLETSGKPQPKNATRDCQARRDAFDSKVPFTLR